MSQIPNSEVVASITELMDWVFAMVDSKRFRDWRALNVRSNWRIVLRTTEGVNLIVKLDLRRPPSTEDRELYVDAKHRVDFEHLFRETCSCWEGGRPDVHSANAKTAFAKIGYRHVMWQLN